MKIASYLDFNLQAYQERLGLVNFLDEQGLLQQCSPAELDKVANYLLYAEDVDAEVELKEGSKKKVSYETLIETTLGESTVQRSEEISIYRVPRPSIDREKDADIPFMKQLWEAIDWVDERYRYCREVLEGKRDMDPERKLIPTYQTKYFLREWMIDLRREQFLLKDSYRPVVGTTGGFPSHVDKPDYLGMCIGPHILCDIDTKVDFGNWRHIHAMLKYYNGMVPKIEDNIHHPWWDPYMFLDELMRRVRLSPEHRLILEEKIDHVSNEDIVKHLEEMGGKTYSINYISTIWKQHITKQLVKQAYLWWEERTHQPDGTLENMTKWRICPQCGRQLYAHDLNFGRYQDGSWKEICKDCTYENKLAKERRREERNARKNSK